MKHIFQLLYGISSHPWKSLAKYWLCIKLKAMKLFTVVNGWRGPFAKTPNDHYQKYFEIFKAFIIKLNTLKTDGNIQYHQLTVNDINGYLIQFRDIKPTVEINNPTINFTPIYKEITTIKTTSWDYDLAYKIAHRAINTRVKLKKLKFITLDTCPLWRQYPETINHLFMNCAIMQPTIHYIEDTVSTTIHLTVIWHYNMSTHQESTNMPGVWSDNVFWWCMWRFGLIVTKSFLLETLLVKMQ